VTDPDPLAALAAQLEQLRGQLARTQGELGAVRAQLEGETSQTAMLRLDVKNQRERLGQAIEKRRLDPPPAPWWEVDEAEARAMMAELRGWVDTWLRRNYPDYLTRLPKCWAWHGDAVWELSTLHAEWTRIYGDEENRDLQGALTWLNRYFPDTLDRLAAVIKCLPEMCQRAPRP
jgi:hypothetical protein